VGVSEQFPARLLSKPISSTFFSPSSRGRLVVALAFRVLPVAGLQDDQQPEGPAQDDGARRRRHARAASRRPASTARRASAATRSAGPRRRRHCRTAAGPGRRRAAPRPRRTGSRRRASAACTPRSGASPSSAFAAAAPARLSITTKAKSRRHLLFLILRTARDDYGAVLEGTTRPARGRGVMSSLLVTRGVSSQKLSGGRRPAPRAPRGASPVCRRRMCPSLTGKRL
jgi:hypothetical protein